MSQQVLVQLAAANQPDHRQAQALLEDRSRAPRDRAWNGAADIGMMADIGGEGAHRTIDEHRRDDGDVGHVRAAGEIRIVQHERVAVAHVGDVAMRQHGVDAAKQ